MIFDFHTHVFDKAFNSLSVYASDSTLPDEELQKERIRPKENVLDLGMILAKEVNFTSQTHLESLEKGGFKCVCVALYPLEQVFTNFKPWAKIFATITTAVLKNKSLPIKIGDISNKLIATVTGYEKNDIDKIAKGEVSYFKKLKNEHAFVVYNQNQIGAKVKYEIARNYQDVKRINQSGSIAVILSVEGVTVCYDSFDFPKMVRKQKNGSITPFLRKCHQNVKEFKKLDPCPFIVTLAHHQYNFISGNTLSFIDLPKKVLKQLYRTRVRQGGRLQYITQIGITSWGMKIIETLLDANEGNGRVLIDTKHMSINARKEYHSFVKKRNKAGDAIPIVQTHTAVSGRRYDEPSSRVIKKTTELRNKWLKQVPFNAGSINLFDEEILEIVESDGMIGLMIDEKRLIGKTFHPDTMKLIEEMNIPDIYKRYKTDEFYTEYLNTDLESEPLKKLLYQKDKMKRKRASLSKKILRKGRLESKGKPVPDRLREQIGDLQAEVKSLEKILIPFEMSIVLNQFFHILKVCDSLGSKAWDHICIGTDYDGVINSLDSLYYAEQFKDFKFHLRFHWNRGIQRARNGETEFDNYPKYLFGRKVGHYIDKILWGNSDRFLKKYFIKRYRKTQ